MWTYVQLIVLASLFRTVEGNQVDLAKIERLAWRSSMWSRTQRSDAIFFILFSRVEIIEEPESIEIKNREGVQVLRLFSGAHLLRPITRDPSLSIAQNN
jgi:hypothetical protein